MSQFILTASIIAAELLLFIPLWNLFSTPVLSKYPISNLKKLDSLPKVTIMVPMRNEAHNIIQTLPKILNLNYPNFEVILVDDNSTDDTYELCQSIIGPHAQRNKVRLIKGKKLPDGWMGKQWALHQGAKHATGELYLFLDADVFVTKNALLKLLAAKIKENVDLMSFFTQQIKISFGERLLVPLVNWGLLSFLPLWLTNNDNSSFFAVAQGQCVLVTKKAYFSVGGHECVRSAILDDAQLAIEFKKKGFNILIGTAKEVINCRMYRSLKESFMGFSKNTFTATKVHWSVFLFLYTVIFIISLLAYIGPFFSLMFLPLTFWVVLQQLIFWRLAGEDFWFNIIFYPVQITLFYVVGLHSFFYSVFSKVEWKGREYKL